MFVRDLREGLVLAADVRDVNGRLLMGVGTVMTQRFIDVLKSWGVAAVPVEGEAGSGCAASVQLADTQIPAGQDQGPDPEEVERQARRVAAARLSRNPDPHPFLQETQEQIARRVARRIAGGQDVTPPSLGHAPPPSGQEQRLDLDALLDANPELGAMPEVLTRLAQAMEDPGVCPLELADIIQSDPGLAVKLLKAVNSALYGFPQRIETISRAVTIVGVQQLSALALGVTVMGLFRDLPAGALDVRAFWRHSLACACSARALASCLGLPNTERYFVGGLLHDIGVLLFIQYLPARLGEVLASVRAGQETLCDAERRVLGVDHAKAGGCLLHAWGLPQSLVLAAASHHDPLNAGPSRESAIVHVADFLAEALVGGAGGQQVLPPLDLEAVDQLSPAPGTACQVLERAESQIGTLETIFFSHG